MNLHKNLKLKQNRPQIDWVNTLFLVLTPIAAFIITIIHFYLEGFSWGIWGFFALFYIASGLSITAGYHRLFAHRSYQTNNFIKLFYLLFGASCFQNSAAKWSADHRIHHRYVDGQDDPYSIQKGLFYAHMGWIFYKEQSSTKRKIPADLTTDPLVAWQQKYYLPIGVIMGFILPTLVGLALGFPVGGLGVLGFLKIVSVHHSTFFINSLCHKLGKKTYTDLNSARDNFILALFTFGEGYHNFHHKFQTDYRNGLRWYHFDPTKWLIHSLYRLGMAKKLIRVPEEMILKAKLAMEQKYALYHSTRVNKTLNFDMPNLDQMRLKVEEAQKKFQQLKAEYRQFKKDLPSQSKEKWKQLKKEKLAQIKAQMKLAKIEFKMLQAQWSVYTKSYSLLAAGH